MLRESSETEGSKRLLETAGEIIALAAGFVLKVKADGWKLFCERLSVPPLAAWKGLPGFDRLERALALAEQAAFLPAVWCAG